VNTQEAAGPSVGGREAFLKRRHTRWARQEFQASPGEPSIDKVEDVLPKRPESEEVVGKNDDETDEDAVRRAIPTGRGASKSYCNDGLGQIQKEVLNRYPEHEPY
jgi:hypothetical protein